jgi:uncharacterized coiled-coil DUF342 family protein
MSASVISISLIIVLAIAVVAVLFYLSRLSKDTQQRYQYMASLFKELGEIVDIIERKKEEKDRLISYIDDLKEEIAHKAEDQENLSKLRAELTDAEAKLLAVKDAIDQANEAKAGLRFAKDEFDKVKALHDELASKIQTLRDEIESLKEIDRTLKAESEKSKVELQTTVDTLAHVKSSIRATETEQKDLEERIKDLKNDKTKADQDKKQAMREKYEADTKLDEARKKLAELNTKIENKKKADGELLDAQSKIDNAERKLNLLKSDIDNKEKELNEVKRKIDEAQNTAQDLKPEIKRVEELKSQRSQLEKDFENFQKQKLNEKVELENQLGILRGQKSEINADLNALQQEILHLQGTLQKDTSDTAASDLTRLPGFAQTFLSINHSPSQEKEINLLSNFCSELSKCNLVFNKRTVLSFHTALKCQNINPLTVLAGVSGTGKTLLPLLYAKYFGFMQLVLSVQPRWDSPQDLFGFYNYLEHKYKATDLSRLLWSYQNESKLKNAMTLVLFDEMNLARTEYYFSDFLSKLELRRVDEKDASINLDIAQKTFNLPIPRNLLMIGTMNEDESTQTLSDKVLDRANVLRFGKPAKTKSSGKATPDALKAGGYINRVIWDQWINNPARKPTTENLAEVIAWIDKLNEAMALVGRPFGYRVQQAIVEYVKQYPALDQKAFRWAFADQIEQKLLPKLRGLDSSTQEFESCISQFEDVLKDIEDEELYTAFLNSKKVAQDQGLYIWTGVSR